MSSITNVVDTNNGLLRIDFLREYQAVIDFKKGIITIHVHKKDNPSRIITKKSDPFISAQNSKGNQTNKVMQSQRKNSKYEREENDVEIWSDQSNFPSQ